MTADGTQCKNGPGCTANHQSVPGGRVVAMTVAAAGAGPDPFAGGPPPGAGAACSDDVLDQLTVEANGDPQYRGLLFEPVAVEWLRRVDPATPLGTFTDPARSGPPPTIGDIAHVYSWKEFAANAKYRHLAPRGAKDIGIDAVAEMNDGSLTAIQIKDGDKTLTKRGIDSFLNTATVTRGGVPRYAYQVLIYTNPAVHEEAVDSLQDREDMLVVPSGRLDAAEPDGGWQKLLDDTAELRGKVTRPTPSEKGDGASTPADRTPPERLTWEQNISRSGGQRRPDELDDAAWLKRQYETAGRSTPDIAAELGCSPGTVGKALARNGIPIRPSGRPRLPELADEAWLKAEYETGERTTADIAAELGCSPTAVGNALREHGIPVRLAGRIRPDELDDAAWLKRQYETAGRSTPDIAAELGCSPGTVGNALQEHGIPTRLAGRPRAGGDPRRPDELNDAAWLKRQYETAGRSTADIAAELGCHWGTVIRALRQHGIKVRRAGRRRAGGDPRRPDELNDAAWLKRQYETAGRSTADIAAELGCGPGTVGNALREHGIKVRLAGRPRIGG